MDGLANGLERRFGDLTGPGRHRRRPLDVPVKTSFCHRNVTDTSARGLEDLAYIDERRAEPGVEIGIGELNDGDDPSVDLLAKKGLAERLDVSHDLLGRLVATSQDVYFFDVAVAGDDPRGLDSVDATILSWSAIRSISDQRTVKKGGLLGYAPFPLVQSSRTL